MVGAVFTLAANVVVALLVAATFAAMSRLFPADVRATGRRAALGASLAPNPPGAGRAQAVRWFAASYAIGGLTPASELLVRFGPAPPLFHAASFLTLCLAFLVLAHGLARYNGRALPRWLLPGVFLASFALGFAIRNGSRESLVTELIYQIPFSVSLGLASWVAWPRDRVRWLNRVLTVVLWLTTLHFLAKPIAAVTLGSGLTERDYMTSRYALFSQALSGMLFIGVALCLMLLVVRDVVEAVRASADRDALSGLLNRRAFDRECQAVLQRSSNRRLGSALLFDLDYFKKVNDTHGHAAGDQVIMAFADVLKALVAGGAPGAAIAGRMGGEEFAVLLPRADSLRPAEAFAEAVRARLAGQRFGVGAGAFSVTVSCGIAQRSDFESLSTLLARADRALYSAKRAGRDRFSVFVPETGFSI